MQYGAPLKSSANISCSAQLPAQVQPRFTAPHRLKGVTAAANKLIEMGVADS